MLHMLPILKHYGESVQMVSLPTEELCAQTSVCDIYS